MKKVRGPLGAEGAGEAGPGRLVMSATEASEIVPHTAASQPPGNQYSARVAFKFAERLSRLHRRFRREEWNLGVIDQSAEDIFRNGITQPVRWLPRRGPWEMLADPSSLILPDGTSVLMAEHMNQWTGRGEIWTASIPASEDFTQAAFEPWMQGSCHLSYPFPFFDSNGALWFMVESWEAGALQLWEGREGALQYVGPVLEGPVIDATPWNDGTQWWLFCTFKNDGPDERLHLYRASSPVGPWIAHPANPVKRDRSSSRPAGPLFWADGKLVRPAQDCSCTYGGAIVLHEVIRLDHEGFQEVAVRRLAPDAAYPDGLHTLCPAEHQTVIDGKRWAFQALDVPRKLVAALQGRIRPLRRATLPLVGVLSSHPKEMQKTPDELDQG